jgi:hypothetical protein
MTNHDRSKLVNPAAMPTAVDAPGAFRRTGVAVALWCVVFAPVDAGCRTPVEPSELAGRYTGTVGSPSFAGVGTFELSIAQSGSSLTGSWMATFLTGSNGGTLTGTVEGGHITAVLAPQDPEVCPLALDAVAAGGWITGTYTAFDCRTAITGVISVWRIG